MRPAKPSPNLKPFPTKLSETGLFASVRELQPNAGLIPYNVNVPLWSDHAAKERFVALPKAGQVRFRLEGAWEFPLGTVFIKTFFLDLVRDDPRTRKRLETRLLVRNRRGWAGYTYLWNDEETDAVLIDDATTKMYRVMTNHGLVDQEWYFPSRADCMACHTRAAGFTLGLNTRQLNRSRDDGENQLRALERIGIFTGAIPKSPQALPAHPDWNSKIGSASERARAYLDVNCVMCHMPPGFTKIDLRVQTPLEQTHMINHDPEKPRLGPVDSKIITPGKPARSELYLHLNHRGPGQMPNLATSLIDEKAVREIAAWIRSLPTAR